MAKKLAKNELVGRITRGKKKQQDEDEEIPVELPKKSKKVKVGESSGANAKEVEKQVEEIPKDEQELIQPKKSKKVKGESSVANGKEVEKQVEEIPMAEQELILPKKSKKVKVGELSGTKNAEKQDEGEEIPMDEQEPVLPKKSKKVNVGESSGAKNVEKHDEGEEIPMDELEPKKSKKSKKAKVGESSGAKNAERQDEEEEIPMDEQEPKKSKKSKKVNVGESSGAKNVEKQDEGEEIPMDEQEPVLPKKSKKVNVGESSGAKNVEKHDEGEEIPMDEQEPKKSKKSKKAKVGESSGAKNVENKQGLKILIWNINGIKSTIGKGGLTKLEDLDADIVILQETKCKELPKDVNGLGYDFMELCPSTDRSASGGIAMLSRLQPLDVEYGIGDADFDKRGRFIRAEFPEFHLIGVYMMHSGTKLEHLEPRHRLEGLMLKKLTELDKQKPIIYCGDLNVAHNEIDLTNPRSNRNKTAGFTDQEREDFTKLLGAGFVDVWRERNPTANDYTFWSRRIPTNFSNNIGWRLDYFVVSKRILDTVIDCKIHREVGQISDHCPLTLTINF